MLIYRGMEVVWTCILEVELSIDGAIKNYRQANKMLFANGIKSIFWPKSLISSLNNENLVTMTILRGDTKN